MRWLVAEMWAYLALAFILGMAAWRWVSGRGNALSAEDLAAELASVRTRYEEREAEHRRLKARLAEVAAQLDDARREARSFEAEARLVRGELAELRAIQAQEARAARRAPEPSPEGAPLELGPLEHGPEGRDAVESGPAEVGAAEIGGEPAVLASEPPPAAEPAPEAPPAPPEPQPQPPSGVETASFMAALREGAPDDLTKIKGIGQKLETTLNGLGIYYYRQIADWSDSDVGEMDAKLKFPGRIVRDDWRGQARRLLSRPEAGSEPPPSA